MKKKIAIMLTLILATGTFTACTAEEKMNNDIKTSVVSTTADFSVSEESSETTTEKATKTTSAEKGTVSKETEPSGQNTKSEEKVDSGQNSAVVSATEPTQTKQESISKNTEQKTEIPKEKPTQKATEKPTENPTNNPAPKQTQPPTEKKIVDVTSAVNSAISYGKQLGMHYDQSLNTGNASWFSPTNASYYDSNEELISDCYVDVEYVAYYYQSDGIVPSDLSFNVIAENNKIYVVYC